MNNTRSFTFIRVVFLALLATVASAGLLSAEVLNGKFTLPFETRWGEVTLRPGDYTISLKSTAMPAILRVRGEDGSAMFALTVVHDQASAKASSALVITRKGNKGTVRSLCLAELGFVLHYAPPKSERQVLAQAPQLIQLRRGFGRCAGGLVIYASMRRSPLGSGTGSPNSRALSIHNWMASLAWASVAA